MSGVVAWLSDLFGRSKPLVAQAPQSNAAAPRTLIVFMDGTLSSLRDGRETNVGLIWKLVGEAHPADMRCHYQAGLQWLDWRSGLAVLTGKGINRQIQNAYGTLASWYRPGDRIFLIGFSRGAYAVRSLAGVIERVGLLDRKHATHRNVRQAYRHYRRDPASATAQAFRNSLCHARVPIQSIGVFDTVKALGVKLPLIWRFWDHQHSFHSDRLGQDVLSGFHALAMDEARVAFAPVLWNVPDGDPRPVQQMWFRGTHGDIGAQLAGRDYARPLSNIPLVWMLTSLEDQGLPLPVGWQDRFYTDADAPSIGNWSGSQKFFLSRRKRARLNDAAIPKHPSVKP